MDYYFLKRHSDEFEEERKQVKGAPKDPNNYQFFIPERTHWKNIRKISKGIGNAIDKAFEALEEQNPILEGDLTPIQFEDPK
ncbi:MAG: type I restriction-modification system subunit M N-terminal domain-containing protein [Candidatus Helarchaeota archaeon]